MARDGADSDYLREKGYGKLLEGEIPRSWNNHKSLNQNNIVFSTFEEAKGWSISNGGKVFTRSPDGNGFIPK